MWKLIQSNSSEQSSVVFFYVFWFLNDNKEDDVKKSGEPERRVARKPRNSPVIISYMHNRTPKSSVLFADICIGISLTDTIVWSSELKSCFTTILCEQKLKRIVDTSDCELSEARVPMAFSRSAEKLFLHTWSSTTHNILKMVVETSDKGHYSYLYILNPFLKFTQSVPTWPDNDVLWRLKVL